MPSYSKFPTILKKLRDKQDITQEQLAIALGVTQQTVGKWEKGITVPRQPLLIKIADYFHVTVNYILYGEDNSEPHKANPKLTAHDERDIQKKLQAILDDLDPNTGLAYYNGQEPLDDETRDLIRSSLENSLRTAKQLAKAKYTPKKYRNE